MIYLFILANFTNMHYAGYAQDSEDFKNSKDVRECYECEDSNLSNFFFCRFDWKDLFFILTWFNTFVGLFLLVSAWETGIFWERFRWRNVLLLFCTVNFWKLKYNKDFKAFTIFYILRGFPNWFLMLPIRRKQREYSLFRKTKSSIWLGRRQDSDSNNYLAETHNVK